MKNLFVDLLMAVWPHLGQRKEESRIPQHTHPAPLSSSSPLVDMYVSTPSEREDHLPLLPGVRDYQPRLLCSTGENTTNCHNWAGIVSWEPTQVRTIQVSANSLLTPMSH